MPTFNIPSSLITANVEKTSPSVQPGRNFHSATITLVDTNGQWGSTLDPTRHIKLWGLQQSEDGVNWTWGPIFMGPPSGDPDDRFGPVDPETQEALDYWIPFGARNKAGGMYALKLESSNLVGSGNTRLRLGIVTDANVRLGAQVITA